MIQEAFAGGSWSPAHEIPVPLERQLAQFLGRASLNLLLPNAADQYTEGSLGRVSGTSTAPSGDVRVSVALEGDTWDISLSASPQSTSPSCDDRLSDDSLAGTGASWQMTTFRGRDACFAGLSLPAVSFVEWVENGTAFHIEWRGLSYQELDSWLTSWQFVS